MRLRRWWQMLRQGLLLADTVAKGFLNLERRTFLPPTYDVRHGSGSVMSGEPSVASIA
jgi:hypothetical protein